MIAELGALHPERPYADSRVQLYVDDARSFLQKSEREYDLVVFGFLDSHRLFSSMSSVRLDNYIYTVENIENVRRHLGDDGLLALTFTVHEKWIADRLLLAGLQVSLPLFFAGVVFASHFRYVAEPGAALGANLIGAMVGGLLEYSSLLAGQRALFLGALAFYTLSAAVVMAARRTRLAPAS